jgi:DNA-binding MarR family transcriptional regulator
MKTLLQQPVSVDQEARLQSKHHGSLRLWLRMFTCTHLFEAKIRARLREQFGTTLPRFDLMAQLSACPAGLRMTELSQRLMVTGGNVTGITDQLAAEGLVERCAIEGDKRAFLVRLTPQGKAAFDEMALAHEEWVIQGFEVLSERDRDELHKLLGRVKLHFREGEI